MSFCGCFVFGKAENLCHILPAPFRHLREAIRMSPRAHFAPVWAESVLALG